MCLFPLPIPNSVMTRIVRYVLYLQFNTYREVKWTWTPFTIIKCVRSLKGGDPSIPLAPPPPPPPPPILFFRCANPETALLPGGADPALAAPKSVSALMAGLDLDTDMSSVLVL